MRRQKRILVIGDVMLDEDVQLVKTRTSGEGAPVAVTQSIDVRPGGAGAVAKMVSGLGAECILSAVVAQDDRQLRGMLVADQPSVLWAGIGMPDRETTRKSRFLLDGRQTMRVDRESCEPVKGRFLAQLVRRLPKHIDVVLVADYAKGVVTPQLMKALKKLYRDVPIIVDPRADGDWERYRGVMCLTPNRKETAAIHWHAAGHEVFESTPQIICKMDSDGLNWLQEHPRMAKHFPSITADDQVVDVCGAGDMVLAALGVWIAHGATWEQAAEAANVAAGLKCRRKGAVPIGRTEVLDYLTQRRVNFAGGQFWCPAGDDAA